MKKVNKESGKSAAAGDGGIEVDHDRQLARFEASGGKLPRAFKK